MNPISFAEVEEVRQNVHLIRFDGKEIYLVGTAHVSAESAELVSEVINETSPDVIAVELDEKRLEAVTQKNRWLDLDIVKIIREKQLFFFIGQFIMASFQKKISEKTGSRPGEEFKRAVEMARERGARLVLADRNIGTTLKRAWRLTPFRDKIKFLAGLLASDSDELDDINIEELKKKDAIDGLIKVFADELPAAKKVLIDERDAFLASSIIRGAGRVTVAVVGAGHVPGMLEIIRKGVSQVNMEEIDTVPPPSAVSRILPWIIPAVIIGVFIWGFLFGSRELAAEAVTAWILANGLLAAAGCLIAFAHPLTVLAGFIAAPITSLNPTIGAGFVTAIVQTFVHRPRVRDFEEIQNRALTFPGWWRNRLTRIFLVFIFSSIGSSIGTFVALPVLIKFFRG